MFLGGMALIFRRTPAVALVVFLVAMIVGPLNRLQNTLASPGINPQIEEMRYIMKNTARTETIMDGYHGSGVYRPHAYFFWFLPYNDREGISEKEKQQLLEDLIMGQSRLN